MAAKQCYLALFKEFCNQVGCKLLRVASTEARNWYRDDAITQSESIIVTYLRPRHARHSSCYFLTRSQGIEVKPCKIKVVYV